MTIKHTPETAWMTVFSTGYDWEAELVRDRLDDHGIPSVIYTQKDHAWNLTVGDLSPIAVMVPATRAGEAVDILENEEFSDAELEEASMRAVPDEDAPDPQDYLDSAPPRWDPSPDQPPEAPTA